MKPNASMIRIALALSVAVGCLTSCGPRPTSLPVRSVDATKGIVPDDLFHFTISPDDRWMVYLEGVPSAAFANELVVLNLSGGNTVKFDLSTDEFLAVIGDLAGNRCWTPDSRYCLGPDPHLSRPGLESAPEFVVDVSSPTQVRSRG